MKRYDAGWRLEPRANEALPTEIKIELNLKVGEKVLSRTRELHMQKRCGRMKWACLGKHE